MTWGSHVQDVIRQPFIFSSLFTEGERGRRVRWDGGAGWRCRNSMGGYGGGARLEGKVCLQMGPEEPNQ